MDGDSHKLHFPGWHLIITTVFPHRLVLTLLLRVFYSRRHRRRSAGLPWCCSKVLSVEDSTGCIREISSGVGLWQCPLRLPVQCSLTLKASLCGALIGLHTCLVWGFIYFRASVGFSQQHSSDMEPREHCLLLLRSHPCSTFLPAAL